MQAPLARDGRVGEEGIPIHLAAERNVAASTRNQALSAILFFYNAF
jgi:hypothetical protein